VGLGPQELLAALSKAAVAASRDADPKSDLRARAQAVSHLFSRWGAGLEVAVDEAPRRFARRAERMVEQIGVVRASLDAFADGCEPAASPFRGPARQIAASLEEIIQPAPWNWSLGSALRSSGALLDTWLSVHERMTRGEANIAEASAVLGIAGATFASLARQCWVGSPYLAQAASGVGASRSVEECPSSCPHHYKWTYCETRFTNPTGCGPIKVVNGDVFDGYHEQQCTWTAQDFTVDVHWCYEDLFSYYFGTPCDAGVRVVTAVGVATSQVRTVRLFIGGMLGQGSLTEPFTEPC
jgi:hypothetical protein